MPWFCIKTVPHQENLAQLSVRKLGYETFCPHILVAVKQRNNQPWQGLQRLVPMFSGYIFTNFELFDPLWPQIIRSPGVNALISMPVHGSDLPRPVALDAALIDAIKALARKATQGPVTAVPSLPVGTTVKIVAGPLMDLSGIVTWSNEQRVMLLMSWFSGDRHVEVPRRLVEKIG